MKINVLNINQWKWKFYLWNIKFSELQKIVRFFIRTVDWNGINRDTDIKKIKDISKYISDNIDSEMPLFPTPLVVSLDSDYWIFIEWNEINIPDDKKELALIIDWQHRFRWIDLYYNTNENPIDLELPIVFLLDFDTYQLSEIFANINFKQKPVNRSLYYDIFWSLPPEEWFFSEMQLSHYITQFLNNSEWPSPIAWIIKMLWNWSGLISQSFIVDIFIVFFRNEDVWWKFLKTQDKNSIEDFLVDYFYFIKKRFSDYNYILDEAWKYNTNWHILWKTTWFWAILYLIQDIFQDPRFNIKWDIKAYLESIFSKLTDKDIINFFSKDWEYAWSWWLQSKLYRELSKKIFYNSGKEILKNEIFKDYKVWDFFNLWDLYFKYKDKLKQNFPDSNTIEAKIRRLLQILRDEWYIEFLWSGNYKLIKKD